MPDRCDNRSVGVIIHDPDGRILISDRVKPPVGTSPPAGHVDGWGGWRLAAINEVLEETGLQVTRNRLEDVTGGWRATPCRRLPGPLGTGHEWRVYRATADGQKPRPAPEENRNMRWADRGELQALAIVTVGVARGLLSPEAFAQQPGLEPVWVEWLQDAGLIQVHPADLVAVDQYACLPVR